MALSNFPNNFYLAPTSIFHYGFGFGLTDPQTKFPGAKFPNGNGSKKHK
jgi:hypothetical protein